MSERINRLTFAMLALIIVQAVLMAGGFVLGITCNPIVFWLALTAVAFAVQWVGGSFREIFFFFCSVVVCFGLTLYTFTYNGPDAQSCHIPIQRAIMGGWNPVRTPTVEGMLSALGLDTSQTMRLVHALYAPKLTHYVGASVAKGTHLWVGDAFVGWSLALTLLLYGYSFAVRFFKSGVLLSVLFSAGMLSTSVFLLMFDGFVDFTIYASMTLLVLSLLLWIDNRGAMDAGISCLSAIVCMTSKATGISFVLVFWLYAIFASRAFLCGRFWASSALCVAVSFLISISPVLTAWIGGSSSMDALTSDFVGNADANKMGYLARISYAWVSSRLTSFCCCHWYGQNSFSPWWEVGGTGRSSLWTMILWSSVAVLLFSRKRNLQIVCLLLFITSNAVPIKYIGYARYCPQMGLIPILAFYSVADRKFARWWALLLVLYVAPTLFSITVRFAYLLTLERFRQDQFAALKIDNVSTSYDGSVTVWMRMKESGLLLDRDKNGPSGVSLRPGGFPVLSSSLHPEWNQVVRAEMDPSQGLRRFDPRYLLRALRCPPCPVFERSRK